jgi:hypothetical protein
MRTNPRRRHDTHGGLALRVADMGCYAGHVFRMSMREGDPRFPVAG